MRENIVDMVMEIMFIIDKYSQVFYNNNNNNQNRPTDPNSGT
jgi:hypothetical protein